MHVDRGGIQLPTPLQCDVSLWWPTRRAMLAYRLVLSLSMVFRLTLATRKKHLPILGMCHDGIFSARVRYGDILPRMSIPLL
jgi:hypothetical protein